MAASSLRSAAVIAAKVEQYEDLLNERLKGELQKVHDERDNVHEKHAQW